MKPILERFLIREFPKLYIGVGKPPTESLMSFGFECSDGWFTIIYDLSKALTELNEEVVATQIKEKYGTLRFYIGYGSDEAFELIDAAEKDSKVTCETCGESGKLRDLHGWFKTLCNRHYTSWTMNFLEQ